MKLESIIRRENGTIVKMDAPTKTYHFKPEVPEGPHVADVDIEHHVARCGGVPQMGRKNFFSDGLSH